VKVRNYISPDQIQPSTPASRAASSSLNLKNNLSSLHVNDSLVKILAWTEEYGALVIKYLPKKSVIKTSPDSKVILCPRTRVICNFTLDKTLINEADAVSFEGRELNRNIKKIK